MKQNVRERLCHKQSTSKYLSYESSLKLTSTAIIGLGLVVFGTDISWLTVVVVYDERNKWHNINYISCKLISNELVTNKNECVSLFKVIRIHSVKTVPRVIGIIAKTECSRTTKALSLPLSPNRDIWIKTSKGKYLQSSTYKCLTTRNETKIILNSKVI